MKVTLNNFVNISNPYVPKNKSNNKGNTPDNSGVKCLTQLPNIYYQPTFCAKEVPDDEFRTRLSNISGKLYSALKKEHADKIVKSINQQNIGIAERCLENLKKTVSSYGDEELYYKLLCLGEVNEENSDVAKMLLLDDMGDSHFYRYEEDILANVNKDNISFIKRLLNENSYTTYEIATISQYANKKTMPLIEFLYDGIDGDFTKPEVPYILYNNDGLYRDALSGFGYICKLYAEKDANFPENIIPLLPKDLYRKNIDFMRALFEKATNDSHKELYQSLLPEITTDNVSFAEELFLYNKETAEISTPKRYAGKMSPMEFACELLSVTDKYNIDFARKMLEKYDKGQTGFMDGKQLCSWVSAVNSVLTEEFIWKLYEGGLPLSDVQFLYSQATNSFTKFIAMNNPKEMKEEADKVIKQIKTRPELYANGDLDDYYEVKRDISRFVEEYRFDIQLGLIIFGKEATDVLLRRRIRAFENYCKEVLDSLDYKDLCLVKEICNSPMQNLTPAQKLEIPQVIRAYKDINADSNYIKDKLQSGRFDLSDIKANLFLNIMKNVGYSNSDIEKIPKDNLAIWDLNYVYLLPSQIEYDDAEGLFADVIIGTKSKDFKKYIHKSTMEWGKANAETRMLFKSKKMNYNEWLSPSEKNNVIFKTRDKNKDNLVQISKQLNEDINVLLQSPVKGHVEKVLSQFITNGKFCVPEDCYTNKKILKALIEHTIGQLDSVWSRANANIENPKRKLTAQKTLTILEHLKQRIDDIESIKENKVASDIDWTIKMWDRIPQKDLFQGNYSTCCVGIGKANGCSMPAYLLHSALNMIEIKDNKSGCIVGNALCYFVKDNKSDKISLVIDNVEINNSVKLSNENGENLLAAITKYAENIAKSVTGKEDIPILMGVNYNDVPDTYLNCYNFDISLFGKIPDETDVYVDAFGGWSVGSSLDDICSLFVLNK